MDNLTEKALIIFPKVNTISGASDIWQEYFYDTLHRLPKILKAEYDMDLYYLYTNKIKGVPDGYKPIIDVHKQDIAFLSNYNLINDTERDNTEYIEIKEQAAQKYIVTRGMDTTARFDILEQRSKYIGCEIAKTFQVIIDFERPNNRFYNIKPQKHNDTRIILRIDYNSFKVSSEIGGNIYPTEVILNRPWAFKPSYCWPLKEG